MYNFLFIKIQVWKCLRGVLHHQNMWSDKAITTISSANRHAQLSVHFCVPVHLYCLLVFRFLVPVLLRATCSQSLLITMNHEVVFWLNLLLCLPTIWLSYLVFCSQEKMDIMSWSPWDSPNSKLGYPNHLFKVYLAERFVSFSARVFS